MAKRGRPTAAERALRRERILDAAVSLFAAGGFGATSLDEIAITAGVTKRTLYVDFGDKAAVFAAAVDREHDRIRTVATDAGSLLDVATELVFVLHSDSAVALHRSVIAEAPRFPALARAFYATGPEHSIALLARYLPDPAPRPGSHHRAPGSPPPAPTVPTAEAIAEALYALLLGEPHRRRLLALAPAPTRPEAAAHATAALALLEARS
jgi:AcrR family transcriptional regulator